MDPILTIFGGLPDVRLGCTQSDEHPPPEQDDGLIIHRVYATVPPRVDYELTDNGAVSTAGGPLMEAGIRVAVHRGPLSAGRRLAPDWCQPGARCGRTTGWGILPASSAQEAAQRYVLELLAYVCRSGEPGIMG